ncbi:Hypothetical protein ETEE_0439 [Edwardsiella anguillarum ET080813]|uniref:Uncharacterized protein n=1 Tax=Edwardsiella anguillarum ET080813 TaxID=667120 RepID=A0A076LJ65_9GAMM|nr:Hypothetical protein ETEE_0439 [Edwardsiella anguillarum ET080813]
MACIAGPRGAPVTEEVRRMEYAIRRIGGLCGAPETQT